MSTLDFEYHQILEELKDSDVPFDPTTDTLAVIKLTDVILKIKQGDFTSRFIEVLNAGNLGKVTDLDIQEALLQ